MLFEFDQEVWLQDSAVWRWAIESKVWKGLLQNAEYFIKELYGLSEEAENEVKL